MRPTPVRKPPVHPTHRRPARCRQTATLKKRRNRTPKSFGETQGLMPPVPSAYRNHNVAAREPAAATVAGGAHKRRAVIRPESGGGRIAGIAMQSAHPEAGASTRRRRTAARQNWSAHPKDGVSTTTFCHVEAKRDCASRSRCVRPDVLQRRSGAGPNAADGRVPTTAAQ